MNHRINSFDYNAFKSLIGAISLSATISLGHAETSPPDPDGGLISNWQNNTSKSQDEQPHWESLLGMGSPRLTQGFRYNYARRYLANGASLENYGMGKGLDLIVDSNFEMQIGLPAYLVDKQSRGIESSGWADEVLLGRYRFISANEAEGNYIVSGSLGVGMPTGSGQFSVHRSVFTPTLAAGKGWGTRLRGFSIQSSLSASVPEGNLSAIGVPAVWATAFQGHAFRYVWPEIETAYTHWYKGANAGKNQLVLTYGAVFGRYEIEGRKRLTLGIGYREPVGTSFNTFIREWISMLKLSF